MNIVIIAAMAHDRVIGANNDMPWHLPADLAHFKALTIGKPVIMGRKTYESIGRTLPGRHNIVISRQEGYVIEGADVVASLDAALACAIDAPEVMIMGGGSIYEQALPLADRLELTFIDAAVAGDVQFPAWDEAAWQEVARTEHNADERNAYDVAFVTFERAGSLA